MTDAKARVGIIGVGRMGQPMVKHMIKHGYEVTAVDVSRENLAKVAEMGAKIVDTPAALGAVSDFVILGGGSAVHQFVRIGGHAFIGGLAGVENDIIPYGMALGNRAYLAGLNLVGLKRRGFSREAIHDLRRAYRLLFAAEGTLKERVEDVAAEFESHPQVHEILDFIRAGGDRAVLTPREARDAAS